MLHCIVMLLFYGHARIITFQYWESHFVPSSLPFDVNAYLRRESSSYQNVISFLITMKWICCISKQSLKSKQKLDWRWSHTKSIMHTPKTLGPVRKTHLVILPYDIQAAEWGLGQFALFSWSISTATFDRAWELSAHSDRACCVIPHLLPYLAGIHGK